MRTQISTKYEGDNAIVINVYIKTKFSQIGKVIQNQTNENYNTLMLRLRHKNTFNNHKDEMKKSKKGKQMKCVCYQCVRKKRTTNLSQK